MRRRVDAVLVVAVMLVLPWAVWIALKRMCRYVRRWMRSAWRELWWRLMTPQQRGRSLARDLQRLVDHWKSTEAPDA